MKILVSVDFSEATEKVLAQARTLARALSARVCLLHVTESQSDMIGYAAVFGEFPVYIDPKELRHSLAQRFFTEHQQLRELSQRMRNEDIDCVGLLVSGVVPAETIIAEARKLKADMIIIGSHNKGLWMQLVEGSTCQHVLKQAVMPVLVVPIGGSASTVDHR